MDRISQLPECIVHQILSCLDVLDSAPAELVRMSVLSKNWFNLTASFSILNFNVYQFTKDLHVSRKHFFKYVEYTTSRFCHQNVIADTLAIFTTLHEPAELDIVNRCLELFLKNGVQILLIHIIDSSDVQSYRLPNVLLSVTELDSLTIYGCELPSSLMVDVVQFKSLTRLSLEKVHIDDEVIKYITTSCPLLESIQIGRCYGLKRFCVCGHQNLQRVWICYNTPLEIIDIEAPNLSDLTVIDMDERGAPRMNLASCKTLTTVNYFGHPLPNLNGYSDYFSNFPFIENLFLVTEYIGNNLKLSSHSLRTLMLHSDFDLEEIELSTPNLVFFIYSCKYCIPSPEVMDKCQHLLRNSTHLKACMQCYPNGSIDALWFQKLRLSLDKKNGFKVLNLYITAIYSQEFVDLEKLKSIELPPYELEHVELELGTHEKSSKQVAFVDAVLWCCRPRSLTIRPSYPLTDSEEQSDVVKFTYNKLLQQVDQDHTSIQIVWPSSSKVQKHFWDLKSLSMALPCERNAITFIKEEVFQEEAESQRFADMKIY